MFVHGLINLRGQISTAVGLRELFKIPREGADAQMNVVCRIDEMLVSFLVDQIGDVMELEQDQFESAPDTIPDQIRRFLDGVYKIPGSLLSIINVEKIAEWIVKEGAVGSPAPEVGTKVQELVTH
jgi:purine-binding chemotaxis protein CheW